MIRFCANITQLYTDLPFLDRFGAAAADGFTGIEFRMPYAYPKEAIAEQLQKHGLKQVLFNSPSGDWDNGERGLGSWPGRESEFRDGLELAIEYAQALGNTQLNCLAGNAPEGVPYETAEAVLVENLRYAADRLATAGIKLQIEALNLRDLPKSFIWSTKQFERLYQLVGSDNFYFQYDFYHLQVMQGDLIPTFQRLQSRIAHVQVADNPGRHEPGTGEIAYPFIFRELDRLGYAGWIGCEYVPAGSTSDGIGWMHRALAEAKHA